MFIPTSVMSRYDKELEWNPLFRCITWNIISFSSFLICFFYVLPSVSINIITILQNQTIFIKKFDEILNRVLRGIVSELKLSI